VILEAHVQGVSSHSIDDLAQSFGISKGQVSRRCGEVNDGIDSFRRQPFGGRLAVSVA
jgi:transposase-like protein